MNRPVDVFRSEKKAKYQKIESYPRDLAATRIGGQMLILQEKSAFPLGDQWLPLGEKFAE
jgi:hypothetical protein